MLPLQRGVNFALSNYDLTLATPLSPLPLQRGVNFALSNYDLTLTTPLSPLPLQRGVNFALSNYDLTLATPLSPLHHTYAWDMHVRTNWALFHSSSDESLLWSNKGSYGIKTISFSNKTAVKNIYCLAIVDSSWSVFLYNILNYPIRNIWTGIKL